MERSIRKKCEKLNQIKSQEKSLEEYLSNVKLEQTQDRIFREKYIKSKAIVAIIGGILLLTIVTMFCIYTKSTGFYERHEDVISSVVTSLNTIISILVGIGISTIVLDFFAYIKYTRDRLKEVMIDRDYIKMLSKEEKRKIVEMVEDDIYFRNGEVEDNSLYKNIKNKIIPLIDNQYLNRQHVRVDCRSDEEKGVIIKEIHKELDIVTNKEVDKFVIPFSTHLTKVEGVSDDELYQVKHCKINGNDITEAVKKYINSDAVSEMENPNKEDVKYDVDYEFTLQKGVNCIEMITQTIVSIEDNTFAHMVQIPCKRYDIELSLADSNYDLLGFAFALEVNNSPNEKVIYKNKYTNSYLIRFEDWTLPGDGVVFVINKKNE